MYNKIIDHLFLGEFADVPFYMRDFPEGEILCVLENRPEKEPPKAFQIPIIDLQSFGYRVKEEQLGQTFKFINRMLSAGDDLLVHCMAGQERSPLVVAYYLAHNYGITLDMAYKKVKKKRPQIFDRSDWII